MASDACIHSRHPSRLGSASLVSRAALMWVLALQACAALAPPAPHKALPNQRVIGPQLVTAGQPSRAQLMALKAQGFEAVIHIDAGPTPDSVSDEAQLVAAQAIVYVHVAVDPQALTATNARAISRAIDGFGARRVLVHCEQNMLSSSFVFLYRVLDRHEEPRRALADLEQLWVPRGAVRDFLERQLRAAGIELDAL